MPVPRAAAESGPLLRVAPFRPMRVALIQTRLPGLKESVLDKTVATTRTRLAALGSTLVGERRIGAPRERSWRPRSPRRSPPEPSSS